MGEAHYYFGQKAGVMFEPSATWAHDAATAKQLMCKALQLDLNEVSYWTNLGNMNATAWAPAMRAYVTGNTSFCATVDDEAVPTRWGIWGDVGLDGHGHGHGGHHHHHRPPPPPPHFTKFGCVKGVCELAAHGTFANSTCNATCVLPPPPPAPPPPPPTPVLDRYVCEQSNCTLSPTGNLSGAQCTQACQPTPPGPPTRYACMLGTCKPAGTGNMSIVQCNETCTVPPTQTKFACNLALGVCVISHNGTFANKTTCGVTCKAPGPSPPTPPPSPSPPPPPPPPPPSGVKCMANRKPPEVCPNGKPCPSCGNSVCTCPP